jgi:hypothetical protein
MSPKFRRVRRMHPKGRTAVVPGMPMKQPPGLSVRSQNPQNSVFCRSICTTSGALGGERLTFRPGIGDSSHG